MNEGRIADIPCRCCDGTGRDPQVIDKVDLKVIKFHDYKCSVCKGRGIVRIKIVDRPTNCGRCQGTGRSAIRCANWVFNRWECYASSCYDCHGLGILPMSGKIELWKDDKWKTL